MGFHCRSVHMIPVLLLLLILSSPSVLAYAHDNNEANIESNSFPSENIGGSLKSFDISKNGEILLFFQDASAYGICTIHILDSTGQFMVEHIVTTTQSGSVLACFDDNGSVLIHFVRTGETYSINGTTLKRVSVSEDRFWKTEVPPIAQRANVSHSFRGALYTLSSPGLFESLLNGAGYTLTCCQDSNELLIWSSGNAIFKEGTNRTSLLILIIFNIISVVCIGVTLKDRRWPGPAKVLASLHVCWILTAWIFILLIESKKYVLSWQCINSPGLLLGVLTAVGVMILCDWFLFWRPVRNGRFA